MPNKNKSFEEEVKELQQVVSKLENGDMPLEEAMQNFEKGTALIKSCREKLAQTETKVEKIMESVK